MSAALRWPSEGASPRRRLQRLAAVSGAQLLCGVGGMVVAIRRGRSFDVGFAAGRPAGVARDSLLVGTALSAPATMLTAQAALTVVVAQGRDGRAAAALGTLGGCMVAGYLAERPVRHRLRPAGWDAVETPVVVAGLGLSAAIVVLASR